MCALIFLSACGPKRVQVSAPQPPSNAQPPSNSAPQPPASASISNSELEGLASWYAEPYHGRKTASGEIFDSYKGLTAAHRTLPFNTMVRVTNITNGRQVDVRINDRGPFVDGRVIDLSVRAARQIDLVRPGTASVKLAVLKLAAVSAPAAYAVQVGAFENHRNAEDLKRRLEKQYQRVMIQTVSQEKTRYRVRIGCANIDAANAVVAQLRKQAFKPVVVRLN